MSKKKYIIHIRGCDDETNFVMELTDQELYLVQELCDKSKETSTYGCMPDMSVLTYTEENKKKYYLYRSK